MAYRAAMQEEELRKGPWFEQEDEQLTAIVALLGERRWDSIARASGLRRSGKSCRLRWMNYLRPDLKHGQISTEEARIILQLHERWGNKWSKIARRLPGRTDNEIKNYWRTHFRKKAQVQKQENFCSGMNNAKQDFLIPKGDTHARRTSYENRGYVEDILGTTEDYFDVLELSNYAFASSPYETRLSDWISGLSNDQSETKHYEECNSLDSCFCYPASISEDSDPGLWDSSCSLWNMD